MNLHKRGWPSDVTETIDPYVSGEVDLYRWISRIR